MNSIKSSLKGQPLDLIKEVENSVDSSDYSFADSKKKIDRFTLNNIYEDLERNLSRANRSAIQLNN